MVKLLLLLVSITVFIFHSNASGRSKPGDTILIYKILPEYFADAFSNGEQYLCRDQIVKRFENEVYKRKLIRQLFYLENKLLYLYYPKNSQVYFFIYIPIKEFTFRDTCKRFSYLNLNDLIFTTPPPGYSNETLIHLIRNGGLSQRNRYHRIKLRFRKQTDKNFDNFHIQKEGFEYLNRSYKNLRLSPNVDSAVYAYLNNDYKDSSIVLPTLPMSDKAMLDSGVLRPDTIRRETDTPVFHRGLDRNWIHPELAITGGRDSLEFVINSTKELIKSYKYFKKSSSGYNFAFYVTLYRFLPSDFYSIYKSKKTCFDKSEIPQRIRGKYNRFFKFDKDCVKLFAILSNGLVRLRSLSGIDLTEAYSFESFSSLNDIRTLYVNVNSVNSNIWDDLYSDYKSITELVGNKLYFEDSVALNSSNQLINSSTFTDVMLSKFKMPNFLNYWNQEALKITINTLDPPFKKKVENTSFSYDILQGGRFWLQTDGTNKVIYLSPFLERTVFTQVCETNSYISTLLTNINLNSYFKDALNHYYLRDIFRYHVNDPFDEFYNSINFVMGHELAHIYLRGEKVRDIEGLCDCYSLYHIKKSNEYFSLGIFENYLAKSRFGGIYDLWHGEINSIEINDRLNFLKKYDDLNIVLNLGICDKLFR